MPEPSTTILIVDDIPANLLALSALLRQPDCTILEANSGQEALSLLSEHDVALVLLDVMMPDMDGFEVAQKMKKNKETRHTPIIFVTAVAHEKNEVFKGYSSGAVDYIEKPINPDILRAKVDTFVELFRKQKEIERQHKLIFESERAQFLQKEQAARHAAERAERRFRRLVNSLDHAIIWESDADLKEFTFVSERAEKLLGYPMANWYSKESFFLNILHPEDKPRFLKVIHKAKYELGDGLGERCDLRLMASDGTERWFHIGVQAEIDEAGSILRLRGLSVDINPLKNVEYALRESEERLAFALVAADMGIWDWNLKSGVLDWSDIMQELWGYKIGEFNGEIESFWRRIHPDDRVRVEQALNAVFIKQEDYNIDYRVVLPGGAVHWIQSKGRMFFDTYRKPLRMSGVAINIDKRKHAEEDLRKAATLREEVVAVVSHDLKNPLTSIQLSAGILNRLSSTDEKVVQALKKQTEIIQKTSESMRRLIDDLLDLAKLQGPDFPLDLQRHKIESLMDESIRGLEPLAKEKQIELTKVLGLGCNEILCDRERLLQLLSNLIGNAVKFTPERGMVTIGAQLIGDSTVEFFVSDTGKGISKEEQSQIFNRFWQSDKASRSGTGLGLSIVKAVVDAHHGAIRVESEPQKGTTFYLILPVKLEVGTTLSPLTTSRSDPSDRNLAPILL